MTTDNPLTAVPAPGPAAPDRRSWLVRTATSLRVWARIVLVPVAVIGAVLSFESLYRAAVPVFGDRLAYGFPLLVDALILGASLEYVAGAKVGRPHSGWRLTAHAGIAGTLVLNALAARTPAEVPWHVVAPAVWSVLVELTARQTLGEWKAAHKPPADAIPLRLWLTAFGESRRVWLRMARRLDGEQAAARLEVGQHAAAVEALKLALPGRRARPTRRILQGQLRLGSLTPAELPAVLGWTGPPDRHPTLTPDDVLRTALQATLLAGTHHDHPQLPAPGIQPLDQTLAVQDTPALLDTTGQDTTELERTGLGVTVLDVTGLDVQWRATGDLNTDDQPMALRSGGQPDTAAGTDSVRAEPEQPTLQPGQARKVVAAAADQAQPRHMVAAAVDDAAAPGPDRLDPQMSTGDRLKDAVALLQADPGITGRTMAERLQMLGWPTMSARQGGRILTEATRHLATRLAVVH